MRAGMEVAAVVGALVGTALVFVGVMRGDWTGIVAGGAAVAGCGWVLGSCQ